MKLIYTRPWLAPYQTAIIDAPERYTVTFANTKGGKTASHIVWLFEQALQGRKGQSFWWIAPVYAQAEIAFRRFKEQTSARLFTANESKLRLQLPNGALIEFKSAEKPDNLYGDDVYAAVFDEFTRAREEAWFALRSTLTKTRAKCKLIGNVKGKKNWGYRLAERARQGEDGYEFHKITAWDAVAAGILEKEEVEQAERDLPAHVFKELYLAEPADDDSNPFGLEHINGCIEPLAHGPIEYYGVDLAKKKDWTVIIGLNSQRKVAYFDRFRKDWKATREEIQRIVGNDYSYGDCVCISGALVPFLTTHPGPVLCWHTHPLKSHLLCHAVARLKWLSLFSAPALRQFWQIIFGPHKFQSTLNSLCKNAKKTHDQIEEYVERSLLHRL